MPILDELKKKANGKADSANNIAEAIAQMDFSEGSVTSEKIAESVSAYLDEHLTNPTNPPIDTSLTIAGAAADAKKTGDKISALKEDLTLITTYEEVSIYVSTTATYVTPTGTEETGAYHGTKNVLEGETYKIKSSAGSNVRPYVFMVDGEVLDYYPTSESWGTKHDYDITFTAPSDGVLYINTTTNSYIGLKKVNLVSDLKSEVSGNAEKISDFSTTYENANLFNASEYDLGYKLGATISDDTSYCRTKPIYLTAGSYLYPSTYAYFGNVDKVYLTDEWGANISTSAPAYQIEGEVIGAVTQAGKYNARDIKKFTLTEPHYVVINIGKVFLNNPLGAQLTNFMLVSGDTLEDFPMYIKGTGKQQRIKDNLINALSGLHYKVAIFDGDSISAGDSVGNTDPTYGYAWGGRIGVANEMNWRNLSVGGGVITSASNSALTGRHSVVDNIDLVYASYPDIDYYIFEGGTNDADLIGNAISDPSILGTFSETDFNGTYDTTTFTGAMETICFKAIQYWKGKHIGYIVAQKMGWRSTAWDAETVNRRAYFERAIEVCKKWGIPVINLWDGCYLNPANPSCYNRSLSSAENIEQGYMYTDGQHLTAKGYDYISPMIEAWMKTL